MHDFDELAAFDAVMTSGSLTRSAREMGLAKSTLSRRITQLETRLGQALLRRQANRMLPTEAGLVFHDYCREMLNLASRSREALAELSETIGGPLTLAVHGTLARSWAAEVADTFLMQHPKVELTLCAREPAPCTPGSHCIHVWVGEVPEAGLRQEPLGELKQRLYAHPDYLVRHGEPQHPADLARHALIGLTDSSMDGLSLRHAELGRVTLGPSRSRLRVDLPVLQLDAVANGRGIGVLPEWVIQSKTDSQTNALVPCLPDWRPAPLAVTLLYPYGQRPRRVSALLDALRRAVPAAWRSLP